MNHHVFIHLMRRTMMTLSELIELETEFMAYRESVGYTHFETLKLVDEKVRHLFKKEKDNGKREVHLARQRRLALFIL